MNPVVVVTGASKGIGLAVTTILIKKFHANVVAISRSTTPQLLELKSDALLILECDVTDEKALTEALQHAANHYQGFDGLVLSAGTLDPLCRISDDTPLSSWKKHFDVNFFSLVTAVNAAIPSLRRSKTGGKVVFVSSGAAQKGTAGWGPYNAGKAAMNSLCRTLAEEEPNVVSVAVRPGMVDTNMQTTLRAVGAVSMTEANYEFFVKAHAEGRLVKPEECGHVIAALALSAPKSFSGQFKSHFLIEYNPIWRKIPQMVNLYREAHIEWPTMRRIDVHHHYFPSDLQKEKSNKDVGWLTPAENLPWTVALSLKSMDESGIDYAILSLPALTTGTVSSENRTKARERNVYASDICKAHPQRFGFFATLPFLDDLTGVLAEVSYALDELNADGFALPSSQGEGIFAKYIGDDIYDPLWAELDRRKAAVFLHGAQVPSSTPCPHALLGVPITEVPNETFKAAAHLVVTGRKRKYPNVKVILAHLGGSTPFLAARVAILSRHMGCTLTPEEILEDFKSFYYETALSAYTTNLQAMDGFIPRENLLFGTDFPAVSTGMASWYTRKLEEHYRDDRDKLNAVMYGNALKLFSVKKL